MKHILQKFVLVGMFMGASQASSDALWYERRRANIIDATTCTVAAKMFNDFFLNNPELSLLESGFYGGGAWVFGEVSETIYKKIFKLLTKQNLKNTLGNSDILGTEIDNQRLLRRVITLLALGAALKIRS